MLFNKRVLLLIGAHAAVLATAFVTPARFGVASQQRCIVAAIFSEVNGVAEEAAAEVPAVEMPTIAEEHTAVEEAVTPVAKDEKERFTMFVGNLPFQTTDSEVRDMFSKFGKVALVSVPRNRETGQSRGFAFVDMTSKEEVEQAVAGVNGMMFGGRTVRVAESLPKDAKKPSEPVIEEGVKKIYVGNIPFDTDKSELIDFYSQYGAVKDLYIPFDVSTGQARGFAFVTMSDEDADNAIEATNGADFNGRTLAVSVPLPRGEKGKGRPVSKPKAPTAGRTKLYVGNLSFYTSLDTVSGLFEEYGEVVDCYLPEDRESGSSRGFAFVTMATEDAMRAVEETDGYELDGRIIRVNEAQPKARGGGGGRRSSENYDNDGDNYGDSGDEEY